MNYNFDIKRFNFSQYSYSLEFVYAFRTFLFSNLYLRYASFEDIVLLLFNLKYNFKPFFVDNAWWCF